MRISTLTLKNFRCYYGQHEPIDLSTTPTANVVLVFGENMKGKTSLLQAIRWCLYGEARDRQGRHIPLVDPETKEQLLSRTAESDGDYSLSVQVEFEHEGQQYRLTREAEASSEPVADTDFRIVKELQTGTRVFSENLVDAVVQNMLSEDVSRFFLFDAEMLEEYEDLLKNPEQEALAVKQAIEKILGLPALKVFTALKEEADAADSRQNAHLKKRAKHDELLEAVNRLANEIRGKTTDISEMERDRDRIQIQANDAELAVRQNADIDAKIKQKNVLESQVGIEQSRLREAQDAIARVLQTTWWIPVVPQIAQRLEHLREERSDAMSALQDLYRVQEIEVSTADKRCSLCHQPLDHGVLKNVQDEATRLKLAHFGMDVTTLFEAARRADTYEQYNSQDGLAEIRVRQETAISAQVAIGELETRIDEISTSMGNRAYGDYNAKYERWQRLCGEVDKRNQGIKDLRNELQQLVDEHARKQAQLNRMPDADPALALETGIYQFLADAFEDAVAAFRDDLRETVGDDASKIFRNLTTEKRYQGLSIDENYGLKLLDSTGEPVPGRSAGAEQIIALSLIGGLNRAAVREGPVVMDSNFARLDQGHRGNVLHFLPELGPQVVVLVHSGEITKDEDLATHGVSVARRLEIVPVSETQSRVVPESL